MLPCHPFPGDLTNIHIWPFDNSNTCHLHLASGDTNDTNDDVTTASSINEPGDLNDVDNNPKRLDTWDSPPVSQTWRSPFDESRDIFKSYNQVQP